MLSKRMARHGVALSGGSLAAALSQSAAFGSVPTPLVSSTVRAACQLAAGQAVTAGVISAQVTALTEGMLKTMLLTKLKTMTAVLLVVMAAGGTGVGLLAYHAAASQVPVAKDEEALKPAPREAPKEGEAKPIEGTWRVIEVDANGKHSAQETSTKQRWVITRDRLTMHYDDGGSDEITYQVDPTQKPKRIDLTFSTGAFGGMTFLGIFELNGDQLKVCYTKAQGKRPSEFDVSGENARGGLRFVLKREPAADKRKGVEPANKAEPKAREPEQKPEAKDTKVQALLQERLATLREIVAVTEKLNKESGTIPLEEVLHARLQLHKAELEQCESDKERVKVHEKIVQVAKELEAILNQRFQAGRITPVDALKAKVNRLEAEVSLERVKAKVAPQAK